MNSQPQITIEQKFRCAALRDLLSDEQDIWPTYVGLLANLEGLDIDAEFGSKPVQDYINFMGNHVRAWLRNEAPDIESDPHLFEYLHQIIADAAKAERGK